MNQTVRLVELLETLGVLLVPNAAQQFAASPVPDIKTLRGALTLAFVISPVNGNILVTSWVQL